jgi:hypothetical protein
LKVSGPMNSASRRCSLTISCWVFIVRLQVE